MNTSMNPTKEQVRNFLQHRIAEHSPPPSMKDIRRELGWDLIEADREQKHHIERGQP